MPSRARATRRERGNHRLVFRDRRVERGHFPPRRVTACACSALRARSSLISRLVARIARASVRAPPKTRCGRGTRRRPAWQSAPLVSREAATADSNDSATRPAQRRPRSPPGTARRSGPRTHRHESLGRRVCAAARRRRSRPPGTRSGPHCARARSRGQPPRARAAARRRARAGRRARRPRRARNAGRPRDSRPPRSELADVAVRLGEDQAAACRTRRAPHRAPRARPAAPERRHLLLERPALPGERVAPRRGAGPIASRAAHASRAASIAARTPASAPDAASRSPPRASASTCRSRCSDVELASSSVRRSRCAPGVLDRVPQGGGGVQGREHSLRAASTSPPGPRDRAARPAGRLGLGRAPAPRARAPRRRARRPPGAPSGPPGRLAPRLERLPLGLELACGGLKRRRLLPVERDLLLQAADLQLARVRGLARPRSRRSRPPPARSAAARAPPPRRRPAPRPPTRARAPRRAAPAPTRSPARARGTARERHLLPAPQLVAQPAMPPRFAAWRLSALRCFSTSKTTSSMRVRFCCAASSFSSAARRRVLYFVTPAPPR